MNILILGALPENKKQEEVYNQIINICSKYSNKINSPIDTKKFSGTDKERYKRAAKFVKDAHIIIAEQTRPSTGQGIEIGLAISLSKPLIVVAKENSKISGLTKGSPTLKTIIYYKNKSDLKSQLEKYLRGNML